MLHLAQNIRLIRLLSGKSQTDFGKKFSATKAMIVSYEKGKANPDELFISRLSNYASVAENDLLNKQLKEGDIKLKLEKEENVVSHETKIEESEAPHYSQKAIFNLTESNRLIAESNASLAESNKELVQMVKGGLTANAPQQNEQELNAIRSVVVEFLLDVAGGKRYKDRFEAGQVYSKRVAEQMGLIKEKGTQKNLDKSYTEK